MTARRILSLWFPRLGAERLLRARRGLPEPAFAVVGTVANRQGLVALNAGAEAAGLYRGQPLADARAICPALVTAPQDHHGEARFLATLRRWAGRFSPWVAEEPPEGLVIDLSGTAHLFGGEEGVLAAVAGDCARLGLSVAAAIADTPGAAWALARHGGGAGKSLAGGGTGGAARNGDAIDQEARATRARAARRPGRGGRAVPQPPPERPDTIPTAPPPAGLIAPPGRLHGVLAPLPLAALRLDDGLVADLARLGLHRIGDIIGMARAPLARRFGTALMRRLDQALGLEVEPISPARPPPGFAVRLTLPDPIGLAEDIMAGIDRLLPALGARLAARGHGAWRIRLQLFRADGTVQSLAIGLAQPTADPARLRPLMMLKLAEVDPGFGIDVIRLEAPQTEPVHARQHRGHLDAAAAAAARAGADTAMADLIARLGARIGIEAITRLAPADSHVPEKSALVLPAAWSGAATDWPAPRAPRPALLFRPEPVLAADDRMPPARFRWRRRDLVTRAATGPERIAPEWWLDEPDWRSGTRDYWCVDVDTGERLWLYYAHGGAVSGGWFCQGDFG